MVRTVIRSPLFAATRALLHVATRHSLDLVDITGFLAVAVGRSPG